MGMYTEIIFTARLSELTPIDARKALRGLIDGEDQYEKIEHPFFKKENQWILMGGTCGTICEFPRMIKTDFGYILNFRSIVKFSDLIYDFIDWIHPYVEEGSGSRHHYAIITHEEAERPKIVYLRDSDYNRYEKPHIE